jgi:hypothetical protein
VAENIIEASHDISMQIVKKPNLKICVLYISLNVSIIHSEIQSVNVI